ncbi:MAG: hypothetical protein ACLRSZ_12830 [Enterococcus faecalis]
MTMKIISQPIGKQYSYEKIAILEESFGRPCDSFIDSRILFNIFIYY